MGKTAPDFHLFIIGVGIDEELNWIG